jgi:hypothetical protein
MQKAIHLGTTTAIISVLVVAMNVPNALALSPYQSGYRHGVNDAEKAAKGLGGNDWYITQPGKGFAFHAQAFNRGLIKYNC